MNNLGKLLYQIRISKGHENVSEYLRSFPMPLSDAYYRDLEAGRKTISIEKAEELSRFLPFPLGIGKRELFFNLLKDLLPNDISELVLRPAAAPEFSNLSELIEVMNYDIKITQQAYNHVRLKIEQTHIGNNSDIEFLEENYKFLPVLHFIYLRHDVSLEEIQTICKKNSIEFNEDELMKFVSRVCISENGRYKRKNKMYRIFPSEKGKDFKKKFLIDEIGKHPQKPLGKPFDKNSHYESSGIYPIPNNKVDVLRRRVTQLMTELDSVDEYLSHEEITPFFIAFVASDRGEYDAKE